MPTPQRRGGQDACSARSSSSSCESLRMRGSHGSCAFKAAGARRRRGQSLRGRLGEWTARRTTHSTLRSTCNTQYPVDNTQHTTRNTQHTSKLSLFLVEPGLKLKHCLPQLGDRAFAGRVELLHLLERFAWSGLQASDHASDHGGRSSSCIRRAHQRKSFGGEGALLQIQARGCGGG